MRFISLMGTAALALSTTAFGQFTINEIRTGSGNNEYVEIKGTPGASLADVTLVVIGDGTTTATAPAVATKTGVVEWLYRFAATDVIGPNGYLVLHNPGQNPAVPTDTAGLFSLTIDSGATNLPWLYQASGLSADTQLETPDNMTFMLVTGFTGTDTFQTRAGNSGAAGQDLDTNDDGILDITPWTAILDSVALKETNGSVPASGQDWWYSLNTAGPYVSRYEQTSGAPVALWTMTTAVATGTTGATYTYGAADAGANATGSSLRGVHVSAASAWSSPAGNGSTYSLSGNGWGTGDYYEVTSSTLNFAAVTLEWDQTRSSTGPATFKVDMSVDGGATFVNVLDTYTIAQVSWSTTSQSTASHFMIANIPNAGNKASAIFRFIQTAVTGASTGTNRIDNINVRSAANETTIIMTYAGPTMVFKNAAGAWVVGNASTVAGSSQDTPGAVNSVVPTYSCGDPAAGDPLVAHSNPFASDACCCAYVGGLDAFCNTIRWDAICVTRAAACATNCTAQPCPADLNLDHVVNGADLGLLLGAWGSGDSDQNGDGVVNGADLGLMLGAWGACP